MKRILVFVLMTTLLCITGFSTSPSIPQPDYYFSVVSNSYKSDIFKNDQLICHLPDQEYDFDKVQICGNNIYYLNDKQTVLKYFNQNEYTTVLKVDAQISITGYYAVSDKIIYKAYNPEFPGSNSSGSNCVCIYDEKTNDSKVIFSFKENQSDLFIHNFACNEKYVVFSTSHTENNIYIYDIENESIKAINIPVACIYGFNGSSILFEANEVNTDQNSTSAEIKKYERTFYEIKKYIHKLDLETGNIEELKIKTIKRTGRVNLLNGRYAFYPSEIHSLINKIRSPVTALFFDSYDREFQMRCLDLETGKVYKTNIVFRPLNKKLVIVK